MNLQLSLKKKWFEMTEAGIKTEDYREITPYWIKRLFDFQEKLSKEEIDLVVMDVKFGCSVVDLALNYKMRPKLFSKNTMTLGYPKSTDTSRIIKFEHAGIEIRTGNHDWGAEPNKLYFVIKHGKRL